MPKLTRQVVIERGGLLAAPVASTRFVSGRNDGSPVVPASTCGAGLFYLESDEFIGTKLRVRVMQLGNAVAAVTDYTIGLYPVTAVAGAASTVSITPGIVITASQVVLTAPAANSMTQGSSVDFDWPASGYYTFGIVIGTTTQANSANQINIYLLAV